MKLLIAILGVSTALLFTAGSASPVPPGALGTWPLDESGGTTLIDASGNGLNGTIHDGHWTAAGVHGYALQFGDEFGVPFAGPHPWATFPGTFPFHAVGGVSHDASLSFWVKPYDNQHRTLFWTADIPYGPDANRYHIYSGGVYSGAPAGFGILGIDYRSPTGAIDYLFEQPMPLGAWNHVVLTREGNTYRLYLNGALAATMPGNGTDLPNYGPGWAIGRMDGGFGAPWWLFNGGIDEIGLYGRALTAAEVEVLYTGELAAFVDVRPDTMSRKRAGTVVTAYVELPAPASVTDIDLSTVSISGPVGTPLAALRGGQVGDANGNGIPDMTVKFDGPSVIARLGTGTTASLTVRGTLFDGMPFVGTDTVAVIH